MHVRAAKEGNLMVSEKKTKIMVMNSEETSKSIEMAGMDLERVKKFVLVGSELNEEGPNGSVSEVRRRRALAAASFEALKRPLWKRSEISVKTKMRVFNACVMSRLLYWRRLGPCMQAIWSHWRHFRTIACVGYSGLHGWTTSQGLR